MVLLLVPLALVALIALLVVGAGSVTRVTGRSDGPRAMTGAAFGALCLGGLLIAVLVGASLFGALDSGGDESSTQRAPSRVQGETRRAPVPSSVPEAEQEVSRDTSASPLGPEVILTPKDPDDFPVSFDAVDRLAPRTVLQMHPTGFEPFAVATAEQCAPTVAAPCANRIPVQFDEDGTARFQYLVRDDFLGDRHPAARCSTQDPPCFVVIRDPDTGERAEVQTVFGVAVPAPGRIRVTPATGLALDGQRVRVAVRGYPPGERVEAMLCAAPDAVGSRCGAPGPTAPLLVGPDGRGATTLLVEAGTVGAERASCLRGDRCGISVASATVYQRAQVVPITFAGPPGAQYDRNRVLGGVAIAAVLLLVAFTLIRRSDWSSVGEAAAPEIDEAQYADLDAIVAALPPEEESLSV